MNCHSQGGKPVVAADLRSMNATKRNLLPMWVRRRILVCSNRHARQPQVRQAANAITLSVANSLTGVGEMAQSFSQALSFKQRHAGRTAKPETAVDPVATMGERLVRSSAGVVKQVARGASQQLDLGGFGRVADDQPGRERVGAEPTRAALKLKAEILCEVGGPHF